MRILFFDIGEIDYKGVEILAAILKKHGHVVDLLLDPGLGKHYYFKLPLLNLLFRDTLLLRKLKSFNPDLIAMSIVTNNFLYFRNFGMKIKENFDVPIIVGGIHPTSVPEFVIKEDWVDFLCIGEGEEAIVELADKLHYNQDFSQIKNLWIKDKNGKIYKNPLRPLISNIDTFPFPDRSLYEKYGVLGKRIRFATGRGCIHSCSFCVNSFRKTLYCGQKYLRKRSVENTISELVEIKRIYNPRAIRFEDDVFVLDRDWLFRFKEEYKEKINLPFHCYFTPTGVKEDIIEILKEAGCQSIAMGIQSGNEELRYTIMKRQYSNEQVVKAAQIIKNKGIKLYAEYMFGLPGETPEKMWETLRLSEKISSNNTWTSLFYPYPGTELATYCKENGYITSEIWNKVLEGQGGPQNGTILNFKYESEASNFKVLLPIYNAVPKFLKPFVKFFLKRKYGFFQRALYLISIPILEKREFIYRIIRLPVIIIKTRRILKG